MVQPIVRADGFDDVTRLTIATFAAVDSLVLAWCHRALVDSIITVCRVIRQPTHSVHQLSPDNTPRYDSSPFTILAAEVKG